MLLIFILTFAVRAVKSMSPTTDGHNKFPDGAEAEPMSFDQKIRDSFPKDIRGLDDESSPDPTLSSLPDDLFFEPCHGELL